jgi:hypothetical protein
MGPIFAKTRKGDVAHLCPPRASIERQTEPARPRWILFPRYLQGLAETRLERLDKSLGFARLAQNAFNYRLLAERGFHTLVGLIEACDCYSLEYGDLDCAITRIAELTADAPH